MAKIENDKFIFEVARQIMFAPKKLKSDEYGQILFEHKTLSGKINIQPTSIEVNMNLMLEVDFPVEKIRKMLKAYDESQKSKSRLQE